MNGTWEDVWGLYTKWNIPVTNNSIQCYSTKEVPDQVNSTETESKMVIDRSKGWEKEEMAFNKYNNSTERG